MKKYVVSISYGNYLIQNGGTDKVIREHCNIFNQNNVDYIFLFPIVRKLKNKEYRFWGMNYNQTFVGVYSVEGILTKLDEMGKEGTFLSIFVHHLWRVNYLDLSYILNAFDIPIFYYLHDFHSICANNNFINPEGRYCGFGTEGKLCTDNCGFYSASKKTQSQFQKLYNGYKNRICIIAPSNSTKDIFIKAFPYATNVRVVGHQTKEGSYRKELFNEEKVKIAYIGAQNSIKGWDDFKEIVSLDANDKIQYYYLGNGCEKLDKVKNIHVSVLESGPDAMLNALRANKIDIVLLLSKWPETYSYTYYEALAASCYVICYDCSGNIQDMVKKNKNGIVVDNVLKIISIFKIDKKLDEIICYIKEMKDVFPSKLIPNTELTNEILNYTGAKLLRVKHKKIGKNYVADCIYRIINRGKLNGNQ